jgi:hypothetical protein
MSISDGNIDVSPGARAALARCVELLRPYADEPRIAALRSKLASIRSPEDAVADELTKVELAKADAIREHGPFSATDRERNRAATRDAQLQYLRQNSPAAAEIWERHAVEAGR